MNRSSLIASMLMAVCLAQQSLNLPNPFQDEVLPEFEAIKVRFDNKWKTLYLHTKDEGKMGVSEDGASFKLGEKKEMILSTSPTLDPSAYFTPDLLGGSLTYDVDLSNVGCGCETAFYAVSMPAAGGLNSDDDLQYCNATDEGVANCPQYDIMRANQFGFESKQHKCDPINQDGVYEECDRTGGCAFNISFLQKNHENPYGPGPEFRLDTTRPFKVRTDYSSGASGLWTAFKTSLTQDGNWLLSTNAQDCPYLQSSSESVSQGMAFVISNGQSQNPDWMQEGKCDAKCDVSTISSAYSNIIFKTTHASKAPIDWTEYQFGQKCNEWMMEELPNECDQIGECVWSWPYGDEANSTSESAACRTLPRQRAPQGYTYSTQPESCSNYRGLCEDCDAKDCKWSYPSDDPRRWSSPDAHCRCKPSEQKIDFGPQCGANNYTGECGADCTSCHWSWPHKDRLTFRSKDATCRCPASDIKKIVFADKCEKVNSGQCGNYCKDCHWSWEARDLETFAGESADCRCKNWHGQ